MTALPNLQRPPSSTVELLAFSVGGEAYSVDIMAVREIRGGAAATALPHAPDFVRGVINLRGNVLPILDLSKRLGIDAHAGGDGRHVIIVVDVGGRPVGLMVDAVSDILTADAADLRPPPEMAGDGGCGFVSALFVLGETLYRVLDLTSVVPAIGAEAS